jgi:hypothetical protein
MKSDLIARVAHEINRAYCASVGDLSPKPWEKLSPAQQAGMVAGVEYHLANPDSTPQQQHEAWMAARVADGWTHGEKKDDDAKTHPALLPYDQLPQETRSKDWIFKMVVTQLHAIPDAAAASVVATAIPAVAPIPSERLPVKYIGHKGNRATHKDTLYGTELVWSYGQSLLVPAKIASVMLAKHPEVYGPGDAGALPPAVEPANKKDDEDAEFLKLQEHIDSVNGMPKKAVIEFVKLHYRQEIDPKLSVGDVRSTAVNLIHQFGAPQ